MFFKEIEDLNCVSFPRRLTPLNTIGLPTLCIFADASRDAFGACSYLRWKKSSGDYESRFMSAKSRVAPLKELTIPRLELQAAVLASRLYKTIIEEFDNPSTIREIYFLHGQYDRAYVDPQSVKRFQNICIN